MRRLAFVLAVVLSQPLACSGDAPSSPAVAATSGPLSEAFAVSAARNGVPLDLLLAIAATEGGLEMPVHREVDPDAAIPVAGPLQLRRGKRDTLARGAALMGVSELELRRDYDLALEAGARVVAELGRETGARLDDLASWTAAVEELSGFIDAPHRREYAHRVFRTLARGGVFEARDLERVSVAAHRIPFELIDEVRLDTVPAGPLDQPFNGPDYTGAEWIPTSCTNKCTPTRNGAAVQYVLIHDTEGGWDASVATLQNDPNKSCHYIIGTDGRLGQFVHESVTAWHAGNFHYNERSVGIEHVGYSTKPYTEKQYAKSAELVSYLTKKYSVPKDRAHIIGHDQVPNGTKIAQASAPCMDSPKTCESNTSYGGAGHHTDPGVWEWCTYMPRFGGTCKCNDIWELWNCSYDKTKAFRCTGGKVELQTCDGPGACEVMALGTADVCHQKPPTATDAGTADAGTMDVGADSSDAAAPVADAATSDAPIPSTPAADPTDESSTETSGGCGTTAGAAGAAGASFLAALAALGLTRRTQRRR